MRPWFHLRTGASNSVERLLALAETYRLWILFPTNVRRSRTYVWSTDSSNTSNLVSTVESGADGLRAWQITWNGAADVTRREPDGCFNLKRPWFSGDWPGSLGA
jgi:hypothetical protein